MIARHNDVRRSSGTRRIEDIRYAKEIRVERYDCRRGAEQSRKKRNECHADENNAAARHELLDALRLCSCEIKKQ